MTPEQRAQEQKTETREKKLRAARGRMTETSIVRAAYRTLNKRTNKEDNADLYARLMPYGHFIGAINYSLQTSLILHICTLTDRTKGVSSLAKLCTDFRRDFPNVDFQDLERRLKSIDDKYSNYRNKLIGHITHDRNATIKAFGAEKFTHEHFEQDLVELDYVFKALCAVSNRLPIPTFEESKMTTHEYHMHYDLTERSASNFLAALEASLPKVILKA
jgi:AbiU2